MRERAMTQRLGHVEHVMGTVVSFDISANEDADPDPIRQLIADAVSWLRRVDAVFSTYRDDSQICRLGRGELRLGDCDPDVAEVLDLCAQVSRESKGYFSSTIGGRLDPTGLVKGWSIERASELLRAGGLDRHCINGGGDVQAAGEPEPGRPWNIGVVHPLHPATFATVVAVRDGAVATSGTAERGMHVFDPFTGRPASGLVSVTVVGRDLTRADAYATAALAMGDSARVWVESLDGYEAFAIAPDGSGWATRGFESVTSAQALSS
jgi:thiamine biosynthesis lipoprotein